MEIDRQQSQKPQGHREPIKRKRAAVACEECRARKRKCDGRVPSCNGCSKRMCECVYANDVQAWEWHRNMVTSLRARLAELECPEISSAFLSSDMIPSTKYGNQYRLRGVENPQASMPTAEDVPRPTGQSITASPRNNVGIVETRQDLAVATADSRVNGVIPATVGSWVKRLQPRAHNVAVGSERRSDTLSSIPKPQVTVQAPCTCDDGLNSLCCNMPIRRQSDTLVKTFFARHNRILPILHEQTFMRQYRWLWTSSLTEEPLNSPQQCMGFCKVSGQLSTFIAIVHAVFALGALFGEGTQQQNMTKAEQFFANSSVGNVIDASSDDLTLEPVQLGLLMSLYLQSTEKFSKCWCVLGLTVRLAQSRGLHLSTDGAYERRLVEGDISQLHREMRARLWCICLILDTEISLSFDEPCMIITKVEDTLLPKPIDDEFLDTAPGSERNSQPSDSTSMMHHFVETVKLYMILKEVHMLCVDRLRAQGAVYHQVQVSMRLHKLVMEWRECLPDELKHEMTHLDAGEKTGEPTPTARLARVYEPLALHDLVRRLYCRFMHTIQLILRPSLEMLFEVQQRPRREAGSVLDEAVLGQFAAHCVMSAIQLTEFVTNEIKNRRFPGWWYNVAYLHTCGSTLSIALQCDLSSFNEGASAFDIAACLSLCLDHLSRYSHISHIAQKCHHLLTESVARRTTTSSQSKHLGSGHTSTQPLTASITGSGVTQCGGGQTGYTATADQHLAHDTVLPNTSEQEIGAADYRTDVTLLLPPDSEVDGLSSESDMAAQSSESYGELNWLESMPWPALPSLSQLEMGLFNANEI